MSDFFQEDKEYEGAYENCTFTHCMLKETDFTESDLKASILSGCDLSKVLRGWSFGTP